MGFILTGLLQFSCGSCTNASNSDTYTAPVVLHKQKLLEAFLNNFFKISVSMLDHLFINSPKVIHPCSGILKKWKPYCASYYIIHETYRSIGCNEIFGWRFSAIGTNSARCSLSCANVNVISQFNISVKHKPSIWTIVSIGQPPLELFVSVGLEVPGL